VPGRAFNIPPTKLIHVDIDPFEIGKNYPVEVGIVGDAKAVLGGLLEALRADGPATDYREKPAYAEIQRLRREWLALQEAHCTSDLVPVTIPRFFWELRRFLAEDAIVVTGAGTPPAHMMQCFSFFQPRTNIAAGFSTMGYPLPAAIGAKLAAPERQVVAAVGDGDFLMTMQELAVAAQYDIPILVCVLNNMRWDSIRRLQRDLFGADKTYFTEFRDRQGSFYSPDYACIARGFGIWGERVSRPDGIRPALERWQASGQPGLLEVLVNLEDRPETGLLPTEAWWDVPVPAYLGERRDAYLKVQRQEKAL
jgi:acetolactate synthase-1/2/3 large subunit